MTWTLHISGTLPHGRVSELSFEQLIQRRVLFVL
jgi:hypothetical protein